MMFRISPSKKKDNASTATTVAMASSVPIDPVTKWTMYHNFAFPPALTKQDVDHNTHTRFKQICDPPKVGYPVYHLISQYNPWLDCEMTREKRAFLSPNVGEFCCLLNSGTSSTVDKGAFFRNETVIDIANLYLWPLLHSRADEVVACRSFVDWRRLFSRTITLAFPDYEYWSSQTSDPFISVFDRRRTARILKYITPARVLYLLTTRAGFWPYHAPPPSRYNSRSSTRLLFGICSVKSKIKEYTDKTEIEWLVGAEFLRKMKRVHLSFTTSHSENDVTLNDSESDSDSG
jgi:hypothetical protein